MMFINHYITHHALCSNTSRGFVKNLFPNCLRLSDMVKALKRGLSCRPTDQREWIGHNALLNSVVQKTIECVMKDIRIRQIATRKWMLARSTYCANIMKLTYISLQSHQFLHSNIGILSLFILKCVIYNHLFIF